MLRGFKFGMILQLAVGPVCLYVFKVGGNKGVINALSVVLGVCLIDTLYILLAIWGIAAFISNEKVKHLFTFLGALIFGIFGLETILGVFGWSVLPSLSFLSTVKTTSSFLEGIVLTASNPLTILFWTGVFSTEIAEDQLKREEVYYFGLGCVLATLSFLTVMAVTGSLTRHFIYKEIVSALNVTVGFILIYFALKMLLRRTSNGLDCPRKRYDAS